MSHALGTKRSCVPYEKLQCYAQSFLTTCQPHSRLADLFPYLPHGLASNCTYPIILDCYQNQIDYATETTNTYFSKLGRRWVSPGSKSHQVLNLVSAHFLFFSFVDGHLLTDPHGGWRWESSFCMFYLQGHESHHWSTAQ